MRFILSGLLFLGCQPVKVINVEPGECVVDGKQSVWQLVSRDKENYLFARMPVQEGSPLEIVKDLSVFKKVECPLN